MLTPIDAAAAGGLLGAHVAGRAEDRAGLRELGETELRAGVIDGIGQQAASPGRSRSRTAGPRRR